MLEPQSLAWSLLVSRIQGSKQTTSNYASEHMNRVCTKLKHRKGKNMFYGIHRFFCKNEVGATGVEYALLIGLASLAIIAGTIGLSGHIQAAFQTIIDAMAN